MTDGMVRMIVDKVRAAGTPGESDLLVKINTVEVRMFRKHGVFVVEVSCPKFDGLMSGLKQHIDDLNKAYEIAVFTGHMLSLKKDLKDPADV